MLSADELQLPTERRLLLAAERLFAERGIAATSLRSIMSAAGANVAAVHYHFGSKDDLLAGLLRDRADELHRQRMSRMAALAGEASPSVRDVADVLAGPLVDLAENGSGEWIRVLGHLLDARTPSHPLGEVFDTQWRDWDQLYDLARPGLSSAQRAFRLTQALALAIRVFGDTDGYVVWLRQHDPDVDRRDLVAEVLAAMSRLLDE